MRAFLNTEVTKDQLLESLRRHAAADAFIRGTYGEEERGTFKGCAVGCTLHDFSKSTNNHSAYERLFGIPEAVAKLEDTIFEKADGHTTWPIEFIEAIPVGADLSQVADHMKLFCLTEIVQFDREKYPDVAKAVDDVASLLERKLSGDNPSDDEWSAAWSAAEYAAWFAASSAARSAAWSAASSAARSAAWSKIKAHLLHLLKTAPVEVTA